MCINSSKQQRSVICNLVKIRISYERLQELNTVLELLKPLIKSCKSEKGKDTAYKKAYVELKI